MTSESENQRLSEIERQLLQEFGPLIGGSALQRLLGYRNGAAFRQAVRRKRLAVPTFRIEGRHARFATTRDVAAWLARMEARAEAALADQGANESAGLPPNKENSNAQTDKDEKSLRRD